MIFQCVSLVVDCYWRVTPNGQAVTITVTNRKLLHPRGTGNATKHIIVICYFVKASFMLVNGNFSLLVNKRKEQ